MQELYGTSECYRVDQIPGGGGGRGDLQHREVNFDVLTGAITYLLVLNSGHSSIVAWYLSHIMHTTAL